jgi:2-methylaconitate cis-trans-isomerase PrpF
LTVVSKSIGYISFRKGRIEADKLDFGSRIFCLTEAASMMKGTLMNRVWSRKFGQTKAVRIGHPTGVIFIEVDAEKTVKGFHLKKADFGRTSRRIIERFAYLPESLFKSK